MQTKNTPIRTDVSPKHLCKNHKKNLHWFTLVELIVVITILVILGTIAFTSLTGFSGNARDSDRVTTLKNIESGLDLHQIKSGSYPTPENITGTGTINGNILSSVGVIGDTISRIIRINKIPTDPLSKTNYVYGVNSSQSQYQIATTLENAIVYNNLLPIVYADTSLQARVNGNYSGYIKYMSGTETWIANIPSLLFNNTGSTNLFSTGTYFIVNKQQNLPYKIDDKTIIQNKNPNQIIQVITNTPTATLTGVNITGITAETLTGTFTPEVLANFWWDIAIIETAVLGKTASVTPQTPNSCTTQPTYTAAIFTQGTPTQPNQAWQSTDENAPCHWTCWSGKTLVWNDCVAIPSAPVANTASSITATGITWNWQTSANATSYQFSTNNTTWTDKGNVTTFNETGLVCNTNYTRYIKACSAGGCSTATTLSSASTSACPRVYATWNLGDKGINNTLSDGNLSSATSTYASSAVRANIAVATGKWYWEVKLTRMDNPSTSLGSCAAFGAYNAIVALPTNLSASLTSTDGTTSTTPAGQIYSTSYLPNSAVNDIWGVALDADAKTVSFYRNNSFVRTNIVTGTSFTAAFSETNGGGNSAVTANFGQNAFIYIPPTGYNAGLYQ